jgi:transposase-like protein
MEHWNTAVGENEVERQRFRKDLDGLALEGARRMIAAALELEIESFLEKHQGQQGKEGRAPVVRNGYGQPRQMTVGTGTLQIRAPRVRDRRVAGAGEKFSSKILPRYARRSPKVGEVLPVLYLRGLSTGDFRPALESLLGKDAAGLSPTNIVRLKKTWTDEYRTWRRRDLSGKDYVYIWVDGVHFSIRLEDDRLCALVVLGVLADGTKELVAIEDGYRESKESWLSLLRDLKKRGMKAPALATGDGALGFWGAMREVWPETREQRCWVHKIFNVLDKLPARLQPRGKEMLNGIMKADKKSAAEKLMREFSDEFGAKYPKAAETLEKDRDVLLTFFDFPAPHWLHLRTTNPIESTFSTVKLRTRVTKGAGSRTTALSMAYKLMMTASLRYRSVVQSELVEKVRAGVRFVDGVAVEDPHDPNSERDAA